jgi:tRNA splicing ligase
VVKVKRVEVVPLKEKFGIQHKLYLEKDENLKKLKEFFENFASAEEFEAKENLIRLVFSPNNGVFTFDLNQNIEDFYDENIHREWKEMVASAMGIEEPFRYYSFYTENGEHIGTVGYKQDCENPMPVIVLYKDF